MDSLEDYRMVLLRPRETLSKLGANLLSFFDADGLAEQILDSLDKAGSKTSKR